MSDTAGEKTSEATPRRLAEARRRGEVAISRDLAGATVLAAVFTALALEAPLWTGRLITHFRAILEAAPRLSPATALSHGLRAAADVLLLPLAVALTASVAVGWAQTGGLISAAAVRVDPQRLKPSLGRVFGVAALGEMARGVAKLVLLAAVAWMAVRSQLEVVPRLGGASAQGVLAALGALTWDLGLRLVIAGLILGALDLLWQRHRHARSLRMTRDEVKREHKEAEGDPHHRSERQRLHRELSEQRMLEAVRKADFVVVNPEHIAVAVRYDRDSEAAPIVVAKGERLLAERIKQLAREAGVPIFRDVSLARSLNEVSEGHEIPEALFEAVAELLRVIHQAPAPAGARAPAAAWRRV